MTAPDGNTTDWLIVAVSATAPPAPPNRDQVFPVRGPAVPPPLPQRGIVHRGVPNIVEVSTQLGLFSGSPGSATAASKPPSRMGLPGVQMPPEGVSGTAEARRNGQNIERAIAISALLRVRQHAGMPAPPEWICRSGSVQTQAERHG